MSLHTPAPWVIEDDYNQLELLNGMRGGAMPEYTVSIVNRYHDGDDWEVCEVSSNAANARLIATAPELYEAAVAMLARHDADWFDGTCPCEDCNIFRPLVAKAEGR